MACPADGGLDAELHRYFRPGPGRSARPDRRGEPLRRSSRHQVRDVRRAPGARRDDRRAPQGRVAARRPPPAARARRGARGAAARAGTRAVDGRPGGARRLRREAPEPHHRSHQHHRSHLTARHRRAPRRKLAPPPPTGAHPHESSPPPALVPSEPEAPDAAYERTETRERVRGAIQALPWRERKVIALYYYGEVTMKQIGAEIGVNESRVSQLHARAIRRLRDSLGDMNAESVAEMKRELIDFAAKKPEMVRVAPARPAAVIEHAPAAAAAVVLPYKQPAPAPRKRAAAVAKAPLRVARQQRPVVAAAR